MPARIYPVRPYGRRYAQPQEPSYSPALESGEKFGKMLSSGIGQAIQQAKANQVANQLLNTAAPPRAAWAGGAAPGAGVPLAGTAPSTGGTTELALRQQFQKEQLADQLERAKIASTL